MLTSWMVSSLAAACRRLPILISAALCTALLHLVPSFHIRVQQLCCFVTYTAHTVFIISMSLRQFLGIALNALPMRQGLTLASAGHVPTVMGSALQCRLADEEGVRSIVCLQEDSDMAWFDLDVAPIQVSLCVAVMPNPC